MKKIISVIVRIVSIVKIAIAFFYTIMVSILCGFMLFAKNGDEKYLFIGKYLWARVVLQFFRVEIKISGLEKIKDMNGVMYVSNHASMFDIFTLMGYLPGQVRFVAKKELAQIPIFGKIFARSSNILIDRKNFQISDFKKISKAIKNSRNIIMFAEGTRTMDGKMRDFKYGTFVLALSLGIPIIPITINGSYRINNKNDPFVVNSGKIFVVIHDLIKVSKFKDKTKKKETIEGLKKRVKKIIESVYKVYI